jgi:hypothetical protein
VLCPGLSCVPSWAMAARSLEEESSTERSLSEPEEKYSAEETYND